MQTALPIAMRPPLGFTLLEMLIAVSIAGLLATMAFVNGKDALERARFVELQDTAMRLSIAQQNHRLKFNQFANTVAQSGEPSANRLVFADNKDYSITIQTTTGSNVFSAVVSAISTIKQPRAECNRLRVTNNTGAISFEIVTSSGARAPEKTQTTCLRDG